MSRIALILAVLVSASLAHAQGILLPPERLPGDSYTVEAVTLDVAVRDQIADVQLSQTFRNTSSRPIEASFMFPIPPDATIDRFTLMVDGNELPAKLHARDEAQRIYEGIVRSQRDPALLQYMGYGILQTNVFPIPPGAERRVTLRYSQLCRRDADVTEFAFPLSAAGVSQRPIRSFTLSARIETPTGIRNLYTPTHSLVLKQTSERVATASLTQADFSTADDLRLMWTLSEQPVGATLLSYRPDPADDGYFLLLASPQVQAASSLASAKTVIFVLDKSGSMDGAKIQQARNALKFVLNNLRDNDTFNIVTYNEAVESFRPELEAFSDKSRQDAISFVDGIRAGGSTNIDAALQRAMGMVSDASRPTYVVFLTDGLPTAGEKNEMCIAANAASANRAKARLFAFGVGFDLNARLLDRLATENFGTTEFVRPNQDIENAVSRFYSRMTLPVLASPTLALANARVNRMYPKTLPDLFAGGQIIAVGRYSSAGPTTIALSGQVNGQTQQFDFSGTLGSESSDQTYAFVEKLWATRRVGEIINELDLNGKNQELVDELVRLSTRHGILTPYTAFLAEERTELSAGIVNGDIASKELFESSRGLARNSGGGAGVNLRLGKQSYQWADQQLAQGAAVFMDAEGTWKTENRVQVVGSKALYLRSNQWVDPTLTQEQVKNAEQVAQFSTRYFELARATPELRPYLALPQGCIVQIGNKVYQINAVN